MKNLKFSMLFFMHINVISAGFFQNGGGAEKISSFVTPTVLFLFFNRALDNNLAQNNYLSFEYNIKVSYISQVIISGFKYYKYPLNKSNVLVGGVINFLIMGFFGYVAAQLYNAIEEKEKDAVNKAYENYYKDGKFISTIATDKWLPISWQEAFLFPDRILFFYGIHILGALKYYHGTPKLLNIIFNKK